jgi:PadR family transcriptional regulator, regulatory protein AphA
MSPRISATDAALLGLLTRGGELSGYDVQRMAETATGFFWAPAKSRIYAVLPQLVERGFATSREVLQTGRPNKQLYRITKAGRAALQVWLEEPPVIEPERAPLLLKLYYGDLLDPEILIAHVRKVRTEAQDLKRRLEAAAPAETPFEAVTVRQGLEWARAMIRWSTVAEQELVEKLMPATTPV